MRYDLAPAPVDGRPGTRVTVTHVTARARAAARLTAPVVRPPAWSARVRA